MAISRLDSGRGASCFLRESVKFRDIWILSSCMTEPKTISEPPHLLCQRNFSMTRCIESTVVTFFAFVQESARRYFFQAETLRQVQQCGTVELVKVMHSGYPCRLPFNLIRERPLLASRLPTELRKDHDLRGAVFPSTSGLR